jgi:phosphatidylglycerol lysyltransferase
MNLSLLRSRFDNRPAWIGLLVAAHGLIIIADTLMNQLGVPRLPLHLSSFSIDLPLLLGLTLLYVSRLLRRRKYSAWIFATALYLFVLGLNTAGLIERTALTRPHVLNMLLSLLIIGILILSRKEFVVRSDTRTFTSSLRLSTLILAAAFLYGTGGFLLMDEHDFHQDISLPAAMHYTIDQFDLTTTPLQPHTRRAYVFLDTLTFVSVAAVGFAFVSLFQPLSAQYIHRKERADAMRELVYKQQADSEDFFKLWPPDKTYFLGEDGMSGLAYKVQRGVALVVGDPLGGSSSRRMLLEQFENLCFVNDWRPAFVHTSIASRTQFEARGYRVQLIGKEAIVEIDDFMTSVAQEKYFREIVSRFSRLGFTAELLRPPHHAALIERLRLISNEWLERPGRTERGFMMGYFQEAYLQECAIFTARDAAGTIQAFLNVLPSPVPEEANFDMMRSSRTAPGNINDYLLLELMKQLRTTGVQRLNMGLSPLTGLENEPNTLINRTLRVVYSRGDRFYSFRGLYKFKAKYRPVWSERYVVYKGGVGDFTRVMSALAKALEV